MIFVLGGAGSRERKLLKLDTKSPGAKSLKFTVKKNPKNVTLNLKINFNKVMACSGLEIPEKTNFHPRIFCKIV